MTCARCGKVIFSGEVQIGDLDYHRDCIARDHPELAEQLDKLDPPGFEPLWARGDSFRLHVGYLFGVVSLGRKPSSCALCDTSIPEKSLKGRITISRRVDGEYRHDSQSICLGCLTQHAEKTGVKVATNARPAAGATLRVLTFGRVRGETKFARPGWVKR